MYGPLISTQPAQRGAHYAHTTATPPRPEATPGNRHFGAPSAQMLVDDWRPLDWNHPNWAGQNIHAHGSQLVKAALPDTSRARSGYWWTNATD